MFPSRHCFAIFPSSHYCHRAHSSVYFHHSTIPPFRWAENATELWVTIEIPTAKSTKLDLTESSLSFTANEQGKEFKLEFPLKDKIDASASAFAVKDRGVEIRLVKAESAQGWWNKLTPDAAKFKQHMKVDWDLWADEDDEGEKAPDADFGQGGMGTCTYQYAELQLEVTLGISSKLEPLDLITSFCSQRSSRVAFMSLLQDIVC